jgi:hypothetical protein
MSVDMKILTERSIRFDLGEMTFCEETGTVCFRSIMATTDPTKIREFAQVLEDVAVMMENYGG